MENNIENTAPASPKPQISTPTAIILAGVLIMIGILATKGGTSGPKTLSEQVGVSNASLQACIASTDTSSTIARIDASVEKAMSAYPQNQRGTPYSIVIGANGTKMDVRGAESYANMKTIIADAMSGKMADTYKGDVNLSEPTDHVQGPDTATVTIIEYSDFECPYCKQFHPVLEQIVKENAGNVRWIYRHYPLHQHSVEMLVAADCVAKLKGEDAFWKYGDLLFKIDENSVSEKL